MLLTKYPQSCLLLERPDGGRVLIDPGTFATEGHDLADFGALDGVLYTHRHPDHFDASWTDDILAAGIPIFANADVCGQIEADGPTVVADGEQFTVADFSVTALARPHVELMDGSPGPPNLGFVFDDRLYHPGDSIDVDGIAVDALATPLAGPSITYRNAYRMLEATGARLSIPMHYDMFPADPELFAHFCDIAEVAALRSGESVQV